MDLLKKVNEIECRANENGLEMQFSIGEYDCSIVFFLKDVRPMETVGRFREIHSHGVYVADRICDEATLEKINSVISNAEVFLCEWKREHTEIAELEKRAETLKNEYETTCHRLQELKANIA